MIEQKTLTELLKVAKGQNLIRVDSSLRIVDDFFSLQTDLLQKYKRKEDHEKTFKFFIGLYECRIKNIAYTINVFLVPRDQILVPSKNIFDEINLTLFKRLLDFRGLALNKSIKKKSIPTPYSNLMDLLANEYYVIGAQKDQIVVNKLKKKLRRHRLRHLKEKKVLKNIKFPKTELGDSVKTLLSVLNTETKQSRSRRKKINRAVRKKRENLRKKLKQNRLNKRNAENLLDERRIVRLNLLKEKKEASIYLERLKTYEKACKGTDINPLDILFNSFENTIS